MLDMLNVFLLSDWHETASTTLFFHATANKLQVSLCTSMDLYDDKSTGHLGPFCDGVVTNVSPSSADLSQSLQATPTTQLCTVAQLYGNQSIQIFTA